MNIPVRDAARRTICICGVVGLATLCSVLTPAAQQPPQAAESMPDELLVQFKRGVKANRRAAARAALRATVVHRFDALDVEYVRLPRGAQSLLAARALRANSDVRDVQPNYIRRLASSDVPNDTYWRDGSLWGLRTIGAEAAWNAFGAGSTTTVIANIDTGVNYRHPDLAANMWRNPGEIADNGVDDDGNGYIDDLHGIDTVNRDSDPFDDNGHGTHTAGTAGAVSNNSLGVAGVSWNVRILACKFIHASGSGTDADAIGCFNYVLEQKRRGVNVRVTSNSWGGRRWGTEATVLKNAVDAAGDAGILNVFAAGNSGSDNDASPVDPASFSSPSVIAVAATDEYFADRRALWSNYGAESVDVAAPGVNILSTYHDWYASLSGTSMAAAHVSGAAALLFSHRPGLSLADAKSTLMNSADPVTELQGLTVSGGRLNILRALASLETAPPISEPPPQKAVRVPGVIEAEDFDEGPAGIAYRDGTSGNYGGAYRGTDVDIEGTTDSGGGYNVGWMAAGEWLQYTIDVAEAATYALEARVASDGQGGSLHIEVDGVDRTGRMTIPNTGGWQSWHTLTTVVRLDAGVQRLRVVLDSEGPVGAAGNLNWIRLTRDSPAESMPLIIEAEDFDDGPPGGAYADNTAGNLGGEYRWTDVDIESTTDVGGGYNVGWMHAAEWLHYPIEVMTPGTYLLEARVAADGQGGTFHVEVGGVDRTGPLTIPNTGGWQSWQTLSVPVTLEAGAHRLRVVVDTNGDSGAAGNLNWLRLVPTAPGTLVASLNVPF